MIKQLKWRPIKSAPKDGSKVFLWLPEIKDKQCARRIESSWNGNYWLNAYGNGPAYNIVTVVRTYWKVDTMHEDIQPSHWLPTPDPPKPRKKVTR